MRALSVLFVMLLPIVSVLPDSSELRNRQLVSIHVRLKLSTQQDDEPRSLTAVDLRTVQDNR